MLDKRGRNDGKTDCFQEDVLTPEIICGLSKSAGWPTTDPEDAKKAAAGTRYAVCAFDGDTCVGMARLVGDGVWAWIVEHVVVRPDYQKRGIGKRLMEYILAHLKAQIAGGRQIAVYLVAADGKTAFYSRFGFAEIPNPDFSGRPMRVFLGGDFCDTSQ